MGIEVHIGTWITETRMFDEIGVYFGTWRHDGGWRFYEFEPDTRFTEKAFRLSRPKTSLSC
jgi:hypothetical protein